MIEEQSLLAAVLADPDDDAPRLIYADWLDERGECDRAEFIRVQVALAQMESEWVPRCDHRQGNCPGCKFRRRRRRLRDREVGLLRPSGGTGGLESMWPRPEWSNGLADLLRPWGHGGYSFRRGFPERLVCSGEQCRARLDYLRLCVAPVREVELFDLPGVEADDSGSLATRYRLAGTPAWHFPGELPDVRVPPSRQPEHLILSLLALHYRGVEFTLLPRLVEGYDVAGYGPFSATIFRGEIALPPGAPRCVTLKTRQD
jgi:uncharacterized protein (TIGR02996 family)